MRSYSLSSLKGDDIGVTKADTWSLDNGSHGFAVKRGPLAKHWDQSFRGFNYANRVPTWIPHLSIPGASALRGQLFLQHVLREYMGAAFEYMDPPQSLYNPIPATGKH